MLSKLIHKLRTARNARPKALHLASTLALVMALALGIASAPADAAQRRSSAAKAAFKRANPCPAKPGDHQRARRGSRKGSPKTCPGYVIDHIHPLCAGGADSPANMQWQHHRAALKKDREERRICARPR